MPLLNPFSSAFASSSASVPTGTFNHLSLAQLDLQSDSDYNYSLIDKSTIFDSHRGTFRLADSNLSDCSSKLSGLSSPVSSESSISGSRNLFGSPFSTTPTKSYESNSLASSVSPSSFDKSPSLLIPSIADVKNVSDEPIDLFKNFNLEALTQLNDRNIDALKRHREQTDRPGTYCVLCKKNGELRQFYMSHPLRDRNHKVVCPVLYAHICEICGATGPESHTRSYCPKMTRSDTNTKPTNLNFNFNNYNNNNNNYNNNYKGNFKNRSRQIHQRNNQINSRYI